MYFKTFNEKTREILNKDYKKFNVLSWIIFNTNYQEEYNGLKNRECYFSCSVMEKLFDISHVKVLRVMKELEAEGFIKWVYKSNSKGKKSIIYLCESEPVSEPVGEPVGEPVQSLDNTGIEGYHEPVKKPVSEPVGEPLSINISKNKSNIYMDLTFIDDVVKIEKVKLTQEQYDTLKDKYGESNLHNTIVSLDTYIANGKGKKYINHYLTLNNWLRKNKEAMKYKNASISKEAEPIKMEVWG